MRRCASWNFTPHIFSIMLYCEWGGMGRGIRKNLRLCSSCVTYRRHFGLFLRRNFFGSVCNWNLNLDRIWKFERKSLIAVWAVTSNSKSENDSWAHQSQKFKFNIDAHRWLDNFGLSDGNCTSAWPPIKTFAALVSFGCRSCVTCYHWGWCLG